VSRMGAENSILEFACCVATSPIAAEAKNSTLSSAGAKQQMLDLEKGMDNRRGQTRCNDSSTNS
jgi:hypothetical protein